MTSPQQLLLPLDPPEPAPPDAPAILFPPQVRERVLQATALLLLQALDVGAARTARTGEEVADEHARA